MTVRITRRMKRIMRVILLAAIPPTAEEIVEADRKLRIGKIYPELWRLEGSGWIHRKEENVASPKIVYVASYSTKWYLDKL